MRSDSYPAMLAAVQAFHDKHGFNDSGGEELTYRITLLTEELGEIAACVSKGKSKEALADECADLLILLIGTAISADFDLNRAFWDKMQRLETCTAKVINGHIRVFTSSD